MSQRFGFKAETVHHAIAMYDRFLNVPMVIDYLRNNYESCKGVISEQIVTFVASVSLFISAKYGEVKYPVVEDVCMLM